MLFATSRQNLSSINLSKLAFMETASLNSSCKPKSQATAAHFARLMFLLVTLDFGYTVSLNLAHQCLTALVMHGKNQHEVILLLFGNNPTSYNYILSTRNQSHAICYFKCTQTKKSVCVNTIKLITEVQLTLPWNETTSTNAHHGSPISF